ncbi:MAG: NfeD family protein [Pyrobaculum sp.]
MRAVLLLLAASVLVLGAQPVAAYIDGTVDGTAVSLFKAALADAEARGAPLVVVLNTYGGYLVPTDQIVDAVLNAKVPVYAYIPRGGKAMSAGAFIAVACDAVYMDPTGEVGAAEPRPPDPKVVNYAAGRMRALAQRHWNDSRVDIAVSFVTENRVLTGEEAVRLGMAQPPPQWQFAAEYRRDSLAQLLNALSDPALISLMLLLGVVLIGYELVTYGFQGVGVLGGVLLVLALYLLGQIGEAWLIAALALAGAVLIIAEVFIGHGVFAAAGLLLFGLAVYIAASSQPYYQPSGASYVFTVAGVVGALAVAYVGHKVRQALRRRPQHYVEQLRGAVGVAKTAVAPGRPGVVYALGEEWTAVSDEEIPAGAEVEVVDVEGLTVKVKKKGP